MSSYVKVVLFMLSIGFLGILVCFFPVTVELEQGLGLHMLFELRGPATPPAEVLLVSLGRETAKQLNLPDEVDQWPRSLHARVVDQLDQAGARAIVFDMLFNEPQSEAHDQAFAIAIRNAQNVVLAQAIIKEDVDIAHGQSQRIGKLTIEKILSPIPKLAKPAIAQAPFPLPKIPIALHQFWVFKPSAGDIPTLPAVAFLAYAREAYADFIKVFAAVAPTRAVGVPFIENRDYTLDQVMHSMGTLRAIFRTYPDLADRMMAHLDTPGAAQFTTHTKELIRSLIHQCGTDPSRYLNFYGPPGTIRTIPYDRLLNADDGELERFEIKNKTVFIGLTESVWPQAKDGLYTVYSQPDGIDLSGVEIAATAFANLLERNPIMPLGMLTYMAFLMGWGAVAALVSARMSTVFSAAVILLLNGSYLSMALILFKNSGLWLPIVVPVFWQSPLAYFSALVAKHLKVSKERQNIRDAFGYYLPNTVVDQLMRNVNTLHDGGQILYSTCLFTDAAKYTQISETMDPESLRDLMNAYYEAIFEPIKSNHGIVLQVIGDSVLSIWASPQPDSQQKKRACEAALEIMESVERFNEQIGDNRLPTRIGLHAGYILLGNIGAMDHFEYRPVGDIVNTASRLEGLNKYLKTRILVSEEVLDGVNGLLTRCLGRFVFIGKSNPNTVYELLARKEQAAAHQIQAYGQFTEGLDAFRNQSWSAASQAFAQVSEIIGPDGPSSFYTDLCTVYQRMPPHEGWDGVVNLKRK